MSVERIWSFELPSRSFSTGTRSRPGNPVSERRSSSRSRPASRFDSPSRRRMRVFTLRLPKLGSDCPATVRLPSSVLFSTEMSSTTSFSNVTRGFIFTMMPIGR